MNKNFKIVTWVLFVSSVVLGLIANFLVQDLQARALLLVISFTIAGAGCLQVVLYMLNPKLFRNKTKREE
jgi:zinc transporter ZupT